MSSVSVKTYFNEKVGAILDYMMEYQYALMNSRHTWLDHPVTVSTFPKICLFIIHKLNSKTFHLERLFRSF